MVPQPYLTDGEDFMVLGHAEPPQELIILLYCINTASIVKQTKVLTIKLPVFSPVSFDNDRTYKDTLQTVMDT